MAYMTKRYREMVNTRRLYRLEEELYHDKRFTGITKQKTILSLKRLAYKIWRTERIKSVIPDIRFGRGTPHNGERYSWCDGMAIELAPRQRDVLTLIHELVHAMGYPYHDQEFVRVQKKLLRKYTRLDKQTITKKFKSTI